MGDGAADFIGLVLSSGTTIAGCVWFVSNRFQKIHNDVQRLIGKIDSDIARLSGKIDAHMARVDGQIQVLNSRVASLSEKVAAQEKALDRVADDGQALRERLSVVEYATKD